MASPAPNYSRRYAVREDSAFAPVTDLLIWVPTGYLDALDDAAKEAGSAPVVSEGMTGENGGWYRLGAQDVLNSFELEFGAGGYKGTLQVSIPLADMYFRLVSGTGAATITSSQVITMMTYALQTLFLVFISHARFPFEDYYIVNNGWKLLASSPKIEPISGKLIANYSVIGKAPSKGTHGVFEGPKAFVNKTAAQIVSEIATYYGWSTSITDTKIVLPNKIIPIGVTHQAFIKQLASETIGQDGQPFHTFFREDGTLYFGPKRSLINNKIQYHAMYAVNRLASGEVLSYTPEINSLIQQTSATVTGRNSVSVNPATGSTQVRTADPSTNADGYGYHAVVEGEENGIPKQTRFDTPDSGHKYEKYGAPTVVPGRNNIDQTQNRFKDFASVMGGMYKARLEVIGTKVMHPLEHLRIDYYLNPPAGSIDSFALAIFRLYSGVFQVAKLTQSYGSNGWHTVFDLERRGIPHVQYEGNNTGILSASKITFQAIGGSQVDFEENIIGEDVGDDQ